MDAASARDLFDANSQTYDRVNTAISLGLDARWYDWAASRAVGGAGARVLDAFSGSGAVGLRAAAQGAEVTLADASPKMLDIACRRALERGMHVRTVVADLSADPLRIQGAPFDAVTAMWGLRYLDEPVRVIRNLAGLVADDGRLVLVEFVEPSGGLISRLAGVYFFRVLPTIAGRIAGRRELYRELVASTHRMGSARRMTEMVEAAGLRIVETRSMGFGLVSGIVAQRAPHLGA